MAESRRDEIAKLEALYASNPEGRVFTHLAEAYRRAGELDRAREILERGLQRHPDYPSAHVVLGRVLADQGRDDEAGAAFRRVLDLDPENLIARRSLAETARAAGRDEDALTHYRALLANDPGAQDIRDIVTGLETRLHGPPAGPAASPPSEWGMVQAQETWEAVPSPEPAFGVLDFGEAAPSAEPPVPETAPIDAAPIDLSGIDFGFGPAPTPPGVPLTGEGARDEAVREATRGEPEPAVGEPLAASAFEAEAPGSQAEPFEEPAAAPSHETEVARAEAEAHARPFEEPAMASPFEPEAAPFEPAAPPAARSAEPAAPEPAAPAMASPPAPAEGRTVFPGEPAEPYGVPTETLATLYQVQGFPDRAAAIYRVLLRDRPHDEGLQARARAAEEAAAALRAQRTGIEETREVWVSGDDAGAQPLPAHAWGGAMDEEEPVEAVASPTIGEYLQRLLAWRPSEPVLAAPQAAAGTGATAATAAPPPAPAAPAPRAPTAAPSPVPFALEERERPEPWPSESSDELDMLDGFVFGGEEEEPAAPGQAFEAATEAAPEPTGALPIEYGYGLGPGEEAYGAEERAGALEPFERPAGASTGFGEPELEAAPPEGLEPVGSDLQLDTLLPLPREGAEEPTTWFEPERVEPVARAPLPFELEPADEALPYGAEPAASVDEGEPLPFTFEPADEEEGAGEPLPFALESIGTDVDEPAGEPLPFALESIGADVDDAGEPLPFELEAPGAEAEGEPLPFETMATVVGPVPEAAAAAQEPPFAITPDEPLALDDGMLELEEAEAVSEPAGPPAPVWDPTVALADVEAAQPRHRPEARLRYEPPARPTAQPLGGARTDEEEEDEDLEMFRAWLQSLKR